MELVCPNTRPIAISRGPQAISDRRTGGRMVRPTDQRTDKAAYRIACTRLKTRLLNGRTEKKFLFGIKYYPTFNSCMTSYLAPLQSPLIFDMDRRFLQVISSQNSCSSTTKLAEDTFDSYLEFLAYRNRIPETPFVSHFASCCSHR